MGVVASMQVQASGQQQGNVSVVPQFGLWKVRHGHKEVVVLEMGEPTWVPVKCSASCCIPGNDWVAWNSGCALNVGWVFL